MKLRELAKEYQALLQDGILSVIIWKEGRGWHGRTLYSWYEEKDADEVEEVKQIKAVDPQATIVNGWDSFAAYNLDYIEAQIKNLYEAPKGDEVEGEVENMENNYMGTILNKAAATALKVEGRPVGSKWGVYNFAVNAMIVAVQAELGDAYTVEKGRNDDSVSAKYLKIEQDASGVEFYVTFEVKLSIQNKRSYSQEYAIKDIVVPSFDDMYKTADEIVSGIIERNYKANKSLAEKLQPAKAELIKKLQDLIAAVEAEAIIDGTYSATNDLRADMQYYNSYLKAAKAIAAAAPAEAVQETVKPVKLYSNDESFYDLIKEAGAAKIKDSDYNRSESAYVTTISQANGFTYTVVENIDQGTYYSVEKAPAAGPVVYTVMLTDSDELEGGVITKIVEEYQPDDSSEGYSAGYSVAEVVAPCMDQLLVRKDSGLLYTPCEVDADGWVTTWTLVNDRNLTQEQIEAAWSRCMGIPADVEKVNAGLWDLFLDVKGFCSRHNVTGNRPCDDGYTCELCKGAWVEAEFTKWKKTQGGSK